MSQIIVHIGNIGETFNVKQIIGKTLIAKARVNVRSSANMTNDSNILYRSEIGDIIGIVSSWVQKGNQLWWEFEPDNKYSYRYCLHSSGSFDVKSLKEQGALTPKQEEEKKKAEEKSDSSFWDTLFGGSGSGSGMKTLKTVGIIAAVLIVVNSVSNLIPKRK